MAYLSGQHLDLNGLERDPLAMLIQGEASIALSSRHPNSLSFEFTGDR